METEDGTPRTGARGPNVLSLVASSPGLNNLGASPARKSMRTHEWRPVRANGRNEVRAPNVVRIVLNAVPVAHALNDLMAVADVRNQEPACETIPLFKATTTCSPGSTKLVWPLNSFARTLR